MSGMILALSGRIGYMPSLTVERSLIRHIVDKEDAHRASIIRRGYSSESFLAGGVPYLQLYPLAIKLNGAYLEIYSYRGNKGGCEGVFTESKQTARFANAGVADEEELYLVNVSFRT